MKKFVTAAATIALSVAAQPAFAQAFSGPYVGAEVSRDAYEGQGEIEDFDGLAVSADGLSANGVAGGIYAGYNMRSGNVFYGVEANFDYSSAALEVIATDGEFVGSASIKARESYGIAARIGGLVTDSTALYGKIGYRETRFKGTISDGIDSASDSSTEDAIVYGAGLETALSANSTIRVEYTIADYGDAGIGAGASINNSKVALGLSWSF